MVHDMRLAPLLACLALSLACGGDDDDTGGADASSGSDAGSTADAGPGRDGGGGDAGDGAVMCGGLVGLQCEADTEYCDWPDDSCGVGDSLGECKPRPIDCTNPDDEPVCGCNGRPYDNACMAAAAGADVGDPSVCVSTSVAPP